MEHLPQIVIDLALLLAVAGVTTLICKRFKQPLVLGYVVAGFFISPAIGFIPNVGDSESISAWSEIGMIFLMFGLGLEFSVIKLSRVGRPAIITAAVEMFLMIAIGFTCGTLLGWSFWTSIFLGGMLAISSTTIIIKAFDDLGIRGRKFTTLVFGALVMEDIGAIFLMVVLSTVAVGAAVDSGQVVMELGQMFLYLIIWFVLSIIIIPTLLKKVTKSLTDEIILILAIALCLGMVVLANAIGFSAALGAFIAGSILAGTVQAHRIEKLVKPVKDLFGAVFFVSVGMLVSPQSIVDNWLPIIIVTIVTLISKPIASTLGALASGQSLKTSFQTGLSLSQIGEFSFIIAALGVSLGVTADFLYPIIVTVSVVTTLTTPFYIKNSSRVHEFFAKILPDSLTERVDSNAKSFNESKESSLWATHLKHWGIKVLMVILAALASVEIFGRLLEPLLILVVPANIVDHTLVALCLVITGIFIANSFHTDRKGDFGKLWVESRRYRIPLIALLLIDFLVSAGMIIFIIVAFEGGSPWWIIPAFLVTLVFARSDHLHTWFLQLETLFVGNINERILIERTADRSVEDRVQWAEDHIFVTSVKVAKINKRRGKPVPIAFYLAQTCNLDLISVKRKGESLYEEELSRLTKESLRVVLNDPNDPMTLLMDDKLTFVGTEDEIDAFLNNMIRAGALHEDDAWKETLDEYLDDEPECGDLICFSLRINNTSHFRNKTIGSIDFRKNYGCLIIGLEHNLLPVIKPSRNTRLANRDLILLLGTRRTAEFFKQTETELVVTPAMIANPEDESPLACQPCIESKSQQD